MEVKERWYKTAQRLKEYCHQTSLHGWSYVAGERGSLTKLVWLSIMIGFISLAIKFFIVQVKEYNEVQTKMIFIDTCFNKFHYRQKL